MPPDLADWADTVAAEMGLSLNAAMVQAVQGWADYHGKRQGLTPPPGLAPARKPRRASPGQTADRPAPVSVPKVGPNQPCPCGSGLKYKRCHGKP